MERYFPRVSSKLSKPTSTSQNSSNLEESVNETEQQRQTEGFDLNSLKSDPGERLAIQKYHPNDHDAIRRAYLQKGPFQPRNHKFSQRNICGQLRRFNPEWFDEYDWLEYSVTKDAAFCLYCYLFDDESNDQGGRESWSHKGFTSWNKKDRIDVHIGGPNSAHNKARKNSDALMIQKQSIRSALFKQSNQQKLENRTRLEAAIDVIRYLLNQGLSFRGHCEDASSSNRGNYIELLQWYAKRCENIGDAFKNAPKNNQLTSPYIQKDIITACKVETIKCIIEDLNGDHFSILVDESRDVSCKEQMAIVLRYVDRKGTVMERFIGIVHVSDTSALSLKNAIVGLLAQHSLSASYIRGQCYDGASNMQGDLNGLKTLMQKESKGAHSIHCFAHQLQLTLVAVSKKCDEVQELLLLVSDILNMVGASYKRRDELRRSQAAEIEEALHKGELETGKGLNQELGLARAGDTRWGSHYKCFNNFILMFGPIINVLDAIAGNARFEEKSKAKKNLRDCLTFEVVFMLHIMRTILAITNDLSAAFQKKEQDIANAMILVGVAKNRLQLLRDKDWDLLIDEVSRFCIKYEILIPKFDELYVIRGRSRHKVAEYTVLHHYRVEVFCRIIDWQLQELNKRFDEVTTDLLLGVSCLNPVDSFSSFDVKKILRLAELYPDDFDKHSIVDLRSQLENYIADVRDRDKRFFNLKGLGDLSEKLVNTKKHGTYPLVFRLVKFALLLPVATATVERAFSAMKLIKNDLRNRMDGELLSGCLVPYIEKDVFVNISNESIMDTFQKMRDRRGEL